jgi:adenosine deaminase
VVDEYAALSAGLDFTKEELKQIAKNGFDVASIDEGSRAKWKAEVDALMC